MVHANRSQGVNGPKVPLRLGRPRRLKAGSYLRLSLTGARPSPSGGPFGSISRCAIYRVKSPMQRVHKAEIQPGVGGDAGNNRLAHKARPARVRRRICGERHRPLGPSPSYRSDLKDIGVLLGHRRKILAAVAELAEKSPSASKPFPPLVEVRDRHTTEPPQPARVAPPPTEAIGERRHVTVMFCDLVDSTGIAAKLDAEEWRDLVGAYLDAASAAVAEMGGKVAKKLGDGLMALFGYPVAQENDAERAVRAALSIQRALAELNQKNEEAGKPALAARIAIDTGPAVLDAGGEIFGDVPNVAARAQALAEPGAVVVTARVQRQVAGLFVAEERGSHELKGVPEPVALFRIVRVSGGGRRAGQRHLTPLVGRDEEVGMIMRRWERARQGGGQLVLIVGEPGIGKSRLIEEFHARLGETPHAWVE
jgi:class 3 adenylate cyclase